MLQLLVAAYYHSLGSVRLTSETHTTEVTERCPHWAKCILVLPAHQCRAEVDNYPHGSPGCSMGGAFSPIPETQSLHRLHRLRDHEMVLDLIACWGQYTQVSVPASPVRRWGCSPRWSQASEGKRSFENEDRKERQEWPWPRATTPYNWWAHKAALHRNELLWQT